MRTMEALRKAQDGGTLQRDQVLSLLAYPPDAPESYAVMAEANALSKDLTGNRAEVHGQLALNIGPCPCNCLFCSFAQTNGVFREETRLQPEAAVAYARQLEDEGVNAVYVMTTARYPLGLFLDMSREIRSHLKPSTVMVANIGDQTVADAEKIKAVGYDGVYHALRLREGADSALPPGKRRQSIQNFREAGLAVGTCVEPVGPEHTNDELADMILFTAAFDPAFSGAARRIAVPGTEMAKRGMISELRMAQIVAVTRLAMPRTVMGNCTHEPCTLGGLGGATLFWAEVGANPRDTESQTERGRGDTAEDCRRKYLECGWNVHDGPSRYFTKQSG